MARVKIFAAKYGIWILIIIFSLAYGVWSVNRQNRFQTDAVDLAIFDQPLWHYSRLEAPLSTIKYNTFPGANILGDHFHPLIIPLAFLYRIWNDVRILLIAQDILAVLSVLPIYLLAKKRVGWLFALSLSFAYLAFIGFQTAIDYDFHEVTAGVGIVAWAVYFLMEEKFKPFYFFMILGFLLKEDIPLIFAGFGLFAMLKQRRLKEGLFTLLVSLLAFFVITGYTIPYFKHDSFGYEELDPRIGKTTLDLVKRSVTDPLLVANIFFLPPVKYKTMLNLIGSFSFLPFLDPLSLIPVLPNFVGRFLTGLPQRWLIRYQYNIVLTPLLAMGSIYGLAVLEKVLKRTGRSGWFPKSVYLFSGLLILIPAVQTIRTNSPFLRILNPASYAPEPRFSLDYKLLSMIPSDPNVSVMAQSTFVPHLSHRHQIYRYEGWVVAAHKPDYILMSADEGSDPPYGREVLLGIIKDLSKNPNYNILYYDGVRLLMKKKG
ncbi:MAG: DUF2079 domain-containing protein [Patescibacteria group bacterium]|nr:DUF2079 domain-containing protein [Patescibacteria group bacterium]